MLLVGAATPLALAGPPDPRPARPSAGSADMGLRFLHR